MPDRPEIVCICGSTRFVDEMSAANRDLTFTGAIVVAPGVFLRAEDHRTGEPITNEQKTALDALHLRKIDLVTGFWSSTQAGISASPRGERSPTPTPPASRSRSPIPADRRSMRRRLQTAWESQPVVTDLDIARWRLRSQHLVRAHASGAADVVQRLLGVQAENPSQSAWAVAARTSSPDPSDLAHLLDSGAVLRTHVLRPTWHYMSAEDARWLIELTAPRVLATIGRGLRHSSGMSEAEINAAKAVILEALEARTALTRSSLALSLATAKRAISGHDLMLLLAELELLCLVCSGPPVAGVHTYALFADRVPESPPLERDEALARLAHRYLVGHGPATDRDLAYWATLPLGDVRRSLAAVSDRLESFEHDGRTFWHLVGQQPPTHPGDPVGHLLQVLDETYRGYQDSRWVLDSTGVVPRGRETSVGMALVDGQLVASMKRTTGASSVEFALMPHSSWTPPAHAAIEAAAARYAAFLGVEPVVSINRSEERRGEGWGGATPKHIYHGSNS